MNNHVNFSKKDGQFIQECFKQIIQGYYEQPSPSACQQIILLNTLITQSIAHASELDSSQIVPKLQTLKFKAKGNDNLKNSITGTVLHLRSPKNVEMKGQTLVGCLKHQGLYELTCIILQRLAKTKIKANINKDSAVDIVRAINEGLKVNKVKSITVMVQACVQLLNVYGKFGLDSGVVEIATYLIDNYLKLNIKDKSSIQKCLKIIISASKLNPTIINTKQSVFSLILYYQKTSVFQIHDLLSYTYDKQYIIPLLKNISKQKIDFLYIWSYSSMFCLQIEQENIDRIKDLLQDKQLTNQQECKLYTIINNFVTVNEFNVDFAWKQPKFIKDQKVVHVYLTLIVNLLVYLHGEIQEGFNIVAFEKKCVDNQTDSQAIMRLIKIIKDHLNISFSNANVGAMRLSKNAANRGSLMIDNPSTLEILLPKATKIPKNDEDLKNIHEVLIYPSENLDENQRESLKTLKNKALDSLRISLMKSQNLYFQKIFNFLDLRRYETKTIKRLLQIANLQLKMNPKAASLINIYHLAQIILEIDQKNPHVLDFQQLSEIFYMCLETQDWDIKKLQGKDKEDYRAYLLNKIRQGQKKIVRNDSIAIEDIVEMIDHMKISEGKVQKKESETEKKLEKIQEKKSTIPEIKEDKKKQEIKQSQIQQDIKTLQKKQFEKQIKPAPQDRQKKQLTDNKNIGIQSITFKSVKQIVQRMSELSINQKEHIKSKVEPNTIQKKQKLNLSIILKYKIKQMVKSWIKKMKKSKQRFYKLRQWSETQKTYLEKLLVLRDQIQNPLIKAKFINDIEASQIFPNLDSMIRLCQEMCVTISELYLNFNPLTTQLAPSLKSVTNFLKIYKNYSQNYNNSYQQLKIIQQNENFSDHVKVVNIQNYLFSPVQRFQKYHLFVSQYLRCLPKEHKDYGPLQIQLNCLLKVTDQINQFIENELRMNKMVEMEKKFGNIVSNARQFKIQFVANIIDFKCRVYVFNDLLIVAKITVDNREQLYMRIKLCGKSVAIRQPDCLSFKNRLYICGVDTSVHLTFDSLAEVQNAYKFISDLLETMYQNEYKRLDLISQAQSRIKQGGLKSKMEFESMNIQSKSSYQRLELSAEVAGIDKIYNHGVLQTYFIVKLNFLKPYEIYQVTFCELGILEDLQKNLRQTNPNIKIPSLEIKSKQVLTDDLTKVSEHLCIVVEKFLNFILRNKHLMKKPERTLLKLGLHQSMWIFINIDRQNTECSCEQCLHSEIFQDMTFYRKQKNMIQNRKYKFCILNSLNTQNTIKSLMSKEIFEDLGVQERLIWAQCRLRRIDYRLQNYIVLGKRIPIKVHVQILSDDIVIEIKIGTNYTNSREVIQEICHRLGIQTTLDLALVFVQDQSQIILDDDQILYNYVKILQESEQQQRKSQGSSSLTKFSIFDRLTWGSEADFKKVKKMSLCLRKVVCLAHSLQQKQCQKNKQRYNFIIGQIIRKIKNQTIIVNVEDMQFLCALVYSIENFSRLVVEKRVEIPEQKLKKYLPEAKWDMITSPFVSRVTHFIQNQLAISDKIGVLHRSILKYFWQKYYFQYFPVQNTEPSTLLGNFKFLRIGVCYKKVSVSRRQTNASLLQYPVSRFNYRVYADSLYIESQEKTHCFKGNNLFILDQLIQKYKAIHDFQNS